MHRFLLVRHAAPLDGPDPGLSEAGEPMAEALARRLADVPIDVAWSSDLKRAAETAAILLGARQAPIPLQVTPLLREVEMPPSVADPDYPEREKEVLAGALRNITAWDGLVRTQLGIPSSADRTILVVAHAGLLRVLICFLLGLPVDYQWRFLLDWAGLTVVDRGDDMGTLTLLNDRCHLLGDGGQGMGDGEG